MSGEDINEALLGVDVGQPLRDTGMLREITGLRDMGAHLAAGHPRTEDAGSHNNGTMEGWEYETRTGPRKAFDDEDIPPEGEGWERNTDMGRGGWERFDSHEESYWRRQCTTGSGYPQTESPADELARLRAEVDEAHALLHADGEGLDSYSDIELLAELERRRAARKGERVRVWFYGVRPGDRSGHCFNGPDPQPDFESTYHMQDALMAMKPQGLYPWTSRYDWEATARRQGWAGVPYPADVLIGPGPGGCERPEDSQPEGIFWHWHREGWTWLFSFDRSADKRGNCVMTFVMDELLAPEHSLALAKATYPRVFDRIEKHLGREHQLGGTLFRVGSEPAPQLRLDAQEAACSEQ